MFYKEQAMQLDKTWIGSVSSGTMREEDLIPAFEAVLEQAGEDLPDRPAAVAKLLDGGVLTDREQEEVGWYVHEGLWEALDAIAPEGCYFGAHPGDGADFGFWQCDNDDDDDDDDGDGNQDNDDDGDQAPGEHIRTWEDPANGFRLELYDLNTRDRDGKWTLAYEFYHHGRRIFQGADFHCSPLHAVDSDVTVGALLSFLALKPGDTDREFFQDYTEAQLAFAHEWGEALSMAADDLERGRGDDDTAGDD
jgi:hypothetical protein